MFMHCFEEKGLLHFSYAVGCENKKQLAIIDPHRDVELYLSFAEKKDMVISHVFETHIHADCASGARELAKRARARLVLSGYDQEGPYTVTFPHHFAYEGDLYKIGDIQLQIIHTPGYTPEHISLLCSQIVKSSVMPKCIFTGNFLLSGGVGRVDLHGAEKQSAYAKELYQSMQKLKPLPCELKVYPGQGSGVFPRSGGQESCFTTLGYERLSNPFLKPGLSEKQFTEKLLSKQMVLPPYFSHLQKYNVSALRAEVTMPHPLDVKQFQKEIEKGSTVLDLRESRAFCHKHIPHSIYIEGGEKCGFWSAWSMPFNHPVLLVVDDPSYLKEVMHTLARVGLDHITGYLDGGIATWEQAGFSLSSLDQIEPKELLQHLTKSKAFEVIDVRTEEEWNHGHIQGSKHLSCFDFQRHLGTIGNTPLVFICAAGSRSAWAASLAKREGVASVQHVLGGVHACRRAGFELIS